MPPPDETGPFNDIGSIQGSINIKLPEIDSAAASVKSLTDNLMGLKSALGNFSSMTGNSLNNLLKQIKQSAAEASKAVGDMTGTASGGGGGGGDGGGGGSGGWLAQASQQASQAVSSRLPGGIAAAGEYLKGSDSFLGGAAMGGLRFLRDRIATNRSLSIQTGSQLGMVARQQGTRIEDMMSTMSRFPGNVLGTPQDLLGMFQNAPMYGASYNFGGNARGQGPRAAGMLAGIREAQMLNPGEAVGSIMGNIGGFASDTGAQQRSQMMSGGAFGMIAAGGRQKTLSEWAESILKWLQNLRGGSKRGIAFDYGELMAQYFPGSNIDAWFQANGVPQNMRQYWWTYALEKASKGNKGDFQIGADDTNVAWQRLRATSEMTRTEFNLGGQMMGAYVNKEQANRWFNQLFGQMQTNLIPAFANSIGKFVEYLPDTLEDLLMSGIEGIAAGDVSGDTSWGDIGDEGMYGEFGGTGLAGLSPNMRSKLGPMMRANPRLRINSGLRDNAMQKRLKDKGHSRVSGGPSAHTRGDAADLGPRSQYPWIMANAKKFGLRSGANQGEPWHVGVGDVGDDAWDMFSMFSGMLGKGAGGVIDIIQMLFSSLFGKIPGIGGAKSTSTTAGGGKDFYQSLVSATSGITIGGAGLPTDALDRAILAAGGGGGGGTTGSDAASGGGTDAASGGGGLPGGGPPGSPAAGIAAATALFNAGFRNRKDLETITAISWRESKWNPGAKNQHTSDRGLMQMNMSAHKALMQQMGYSEADLLDIQKNANMAYRSWSAGGGNAAAFKQLWGFSENSPYSEPVAGRPGWDKNGDPLGRTQGSNAAQVVRDANLPLIGDMETMSYQSMPTPAINGGKAIMFNNTFNLGTGGPGGGGIDVRQTVYRVADLLEDEMNRRLSRVN